MKHSATHRTEKPRGTGHAAESRSSRPHRNGSTSVKNERAVQDESDGKTSAQAVDERRTSANDPIVHIEVVAGGMTNVSVSVAVIGNYQGLGLAGTAKVFDRQLDGWLSRALDLGMIGSSLGQLFPIHVQRQDGKAQIFKLKADTLLLAGMGEPGHFAADDLRYLISNVVVAVKSMGADVTSIPLLGTRRNEIPVDRAVRGFAEGILDGHKRFLAIAELLTKRREYFQELADRPLQIRLVDRDAEQAQLIYDTLLALKQEYDARSASNAQRREPILQLELSLGDKVPPDAILESTADIYPDIPVTLLQVTRTSGPAPDVDEPPSSAIFTTGVFQFSALTEAAAISVREVEVSDYVVRKLPERMINEAAREKRDDFCKFFANYFIPDDFRRLIHGSSNLTLLVDESTAAYPWEMTAQTSYLETNYLGTSVGLSRQFRTLQSPAPGSLPPLNRTLKVLVIADPANGKFSLPHARDEGMAVIGILGDAHTWWAGEYDFRVTVRMGSVESAADVEPFLQQCQKLGPWIESARTCDPLELVQLIVNEHFDVIHFAGHGGLDPHRRRAGWVFDDDCFLSAADIFRVRQVPRLVFANACFSALTTDRSEQSGQLVGLAQAFFARGIPNYIGAGWEVDDRYAPQCAHTFYTWVLGLNQPARGKAKSPPAAIGAALLEARRAAFQLDPSSSTWAAYQHYGKISDKLLPFPNALVNPESD
jgi:hypothetical protein